MDRVTVVNYCVGLLGLLLLQGVLNVEGRSIFNPGKCDKLSLFLVCIGWKLLLSMQLPHPFTSVPFWFNGSGRLSVLIIFRLLKVAFVIVLYVQETGLMIQKILRARLYHCFYTKA